MRPADFRIGWRLLLREPGFSAITVAGLAVACAACFLLLGFVRYSFSYDSDVPEAQRIYLVKQRINWFPRPEWDTRTMLPLRQVASDSGMVEHASMALRIRQPLRVGTTPHDVDLLAVDPAFANIFGISPLAGDLAAALNRPEGVAITRATAARLFGTPTDALGQTMQVAGETLRVLAILPDRPANSTADWAALTGPLSRARPVAERTAVPDWKRGTVYLKLKSGTDPRQLEALLQQAIERSPMEARFRASAMGQSMTGPGTEERLVALPDVYFDPDLAAGRAGEDYGKHSTVLGLASVALLILVLAVVNYVNLSTVRTLRRQRETALRKLLGAGTGRVAMQFLAESVLVTTLATGGGVMLAWLMLPTFADLVDRELTGFFSPVRVALALVLGALTGLCAGAYPAWLAVRVRPATALAGRDNSETVGGLWLRRVLTVLQFATAMALTGVTLAVGLQARYASNIDPGFDPGPLFVLDLPELPPAEQQRLRDFAGAVRRIPGVTAAALSGEAIGRDRLKSIQGFRTRDGRDLRIEVKVISPEYFNAYGLRPQFGRLFGPDTDQPDGSAIVLNAPAATMLGYASPQAAVGQAPFTNDALVVGIAPALRHQSLRQKAEPVIYVLRPQYGVLTIRTDEDMATLTQAVDPLWRRYFPDRSMTLQPAANLFAENYAQDRRLTQILGFASMVAIALAAFGIYVLAAYSVQRNTRQIVLRKLYGASPAAIGRLLGREFGLLLACGAVLGLPPAAVAIERYLSGFVERAPLGPWPLLAATGLAMAIALAATARHALAAMRLAPACALRQ
jgi:hypothetical protein